MIFSVVSNYHREQLFNVRRKSSNVAEVYALKTLDRERIETEADSYVVGNQIKYPVVVKVSDEGRPPLSTTCFFLVTIKDRNDRRPEFDDNPYQTNITLTPSVGSKLIRVFATDIDEGNNGRVSYSLTEQPNACSSCFSIDPTSGWITLRESLDRVCTDCNNMYPSDRVEGHENAYTSHGSIHYHVILLKKDVLIYLIWNERMLCYYKKDPG